MWRYGCDKNSNLRLYTLTFGGSNPRRTGFKDGPQSSHMAHKFKTVIGFSFVRIQTGFIISMRSLLITHINCDNSYNKYRKPGRWRNGPTFHSCRGGEWITELADGCK